MDQSATIVINRPSAEVFDYVMEVSHDAEWRSGVVEAGFTSKEPVGVGTTGFDRVSANGRELIVEWTTVEYEPGRLARWTLDSGPIDGSGGYECGQAGDGTWFTLESHVKPTGSLRLLGPIFAVMARRANRTDVQRLKEILEA
ncbi:MAG TPA: SRPBCC family protein [Acidimicrobiia bacterium]